MDRVICCRFKNIFDYISEDSDRYAILTTNKIYQRVHILIDNHALGRIVPEINKKQIRKFIEGNYRIIYRIISETHILFRIYHSVRLLKKNKLK